MSSTEETLNLLRKQLADQTQKLQRLEGICQELGRLAEPIPDSTKPVLDLFTKIVPHFTPETGALLAQLSMALSGQQLKVAELYAYLYIHFIQPAQAAQTDSDKPQPVARPPILQYHQCKDYISRKLGYDIDDTLGKWPKTEGQDNPRNVELRRYWAFLIDRFNIHNGMVIHISSDLLEDAEPWEAEITNAFINEFGDNTAYLVSW